MQSANNFWKGLAKRFAICEWSGMANDISYSEVATLTGISSSYAHQIVSGKRRPPLKVALQIYDATGYKFGGLAHLSVEEIDTARKAAQ